MLSLSKKADYAIIALACLGTHPEQVRSAREVAQGQHLPQALLMNLLKKLQSAGIVRSTRGINGGYRLARSLEEITLHEVLTAVDGPFALTECVEPDGGMSDHTGCKLADCCVIRGTIAALHLKVCEFLKGITMSDLVENGRRIDVPVNMVGTNREAVEV